MAFDLPIVIVSSVSLLSLGLYFNNMMTNNEMTTYYMNQFMHVKN